MSNRFDTGLLSTSIGLTQDCFYMLSLYIGENHRIILELLLDLFLLYRIPPMMMSVSPMK